MDTQILDFSLPATPILEGVEGSELSVTTEGAEAWEFGGGAIPLVSDELTPVVTLAAPGTYFAQVWVNGEARLFYVKSLPADA